MAPLYPFHFSGQGQRRANHRFGGEADDFEKKLRIETCCVLRQEQQGFESGHEKSLFFGFLHETAELVAELGLQPPRYRTQGTARVTPYGTSSNGMFVSRARTDASPLIWGFKSSLT
jgi:hypothetical protein